MLEVWGQDDGFVPRFAGKLDAEIPRIESDERELEVVGQQMFLRERIKAVNRIAE